MIKIKHILPSLREKPRYIKYKSDKNKEYIYDNIKRFIGELGIARAGVKMMENNIIRTNTKHLDEVKSSLVLIKGLDVVNVSGLLNKAKKIGG